MKRKTLIIFAAAFAFILCASPAFAQLSGGCTDSPENPTAVLFLVGGAGLALSRWTVRHRSARAAKRQSLSMKSGITPQD